MKHCKYFFIVYAIAILSSVGANAATTVTGLATPEYVKGAINSLDVSTSEGSGNVVTSVTQTDGKIAVTKGSITSANNGKITITQNGTTKGTFTLNQSGDTTIALTDNDTKYTLPVATTSSLGGIMATSEIAVATDGKATIAENAVTTAKIKNLNVTTDKLAANAVTSAKIADGTIVNADINANAAIAVSKISGAQTTGNLVSTTTTVDGKVTIPDASSTTKYPSMAVAQQIAASAAADKVLNVTSRVNTLEGDLDSLAATVEENKGAAEDAIANLNGTVTGTSGVVKTISQAAGKVTATRGLVATNDLAAGAVTPVKTSGVIGYIPSGSATATTYAQIWVQ